MDNKYLRIKIEDILYLFVILTCVKPEGISEIAPRLNTIVYEYGFYLSAVITLFLFIASAMKRRSVSNFMILYLVFICYMVLDTLLHNGPFFVCINMWGRAIVILFLFESYRTKIVSLLRIYKYVLFALIILNLYYMIQYPQGMYIMEGTGYTSCWLLGYKSSFQYYFLPLITIALLLKHYCNEQITFILSMLFVHIESILALNVMFVVELVIFDVLLVFRLIDRLKLFNAKTYSMIVAAANVIFVFFLSTLINWQPVHYLFYEILGKSTTIFIRINAWTKGIQFIQEKILFGWGYTTGNEMRKLFGLSVIHLHNQFLMLFLQVGLMGTIIFVLLMVSVITKLELNKQLYSSKIISLSLFCLFISVLVEVFLTGTAVCVWPIIYLGQYCKEIDSLNYKRNVSVRLFRRD